MAKKQSKPTSKKTIKKPVVKIKATTPERTEKIKEAKKAVKLFDHKLNSSQRLEIFIMRAENRTYAEISEELKKRHGVEMTRTGIYYVCNSKRGKPLLRKIKENLYKRLTDVPLAHKKKRLEILAEVINYSLEGNAIVGISEGCPIRGVDIKAITQAVNSATKIMGEDKAQVNVDASSHVHYDLSNVKEEVDVGSRTKMFTDCLSQGSGR